MALSPTDVIASVTTGTVWPVKEPLKASCNANSRSGGLIYFGSTSCRGVHCTCGVYAFRTEDQVRKEFPVTKGPSLIDPAGILDDEPEMFHIYGEVSLWGRIIEHKHGYRAQYAYPKSFVNNGPIAQKLAEVYGVELLPSRSG